MKIKSAVIGLGVGFQHALAYRNDPRVNKLFLCESNRELLYESKKNLNADKAFTCWQDLLNEDIDVVSICSYDDMHAEQIKNFALKGVHCMVEKPICLSNKELVTLKKAIPNNIIIDCNLILREYPRFKKIKDLVNSKSIGEIFHIEGDYLHFIRHKLEDGWRGNMDYYSVVLGGGIHLIDLALWIANSSPIKVIGLSNKLTTINYKFDDNVCNIMKLKNGITVKILSTFSAVIDKFHNFKVFGTKGSLENVRDGVLISKLNEYNLAEPYEDRIKDTELIQLPYPGVGKGGGIKKFLDTVTSTKKDKVIPEYALKKKLYLYDLMQTCFQCAEVENK